MRTMAPLKLCLFVIVLVMGTCESQYLPNDVTIRLTDDRYGYLCYKNESQMLIFQGTNPCDPPTCFYCFGNKYRIGGTFLCLSKITPTNEQIVPKYCFTDGIQFYYDYVNKQLKEIGTNECLIPYAVGGVNVPGMRDTCIPSIQTDLIGC